jgi:hypothetical protein
MHKLICVVIIGLLTFTTAFSQECSKLLSQGIYDFESGAADLKTAKSYSSWFCDQKFSTSSKANSFGASIGFPFKDAPIKFGFNSNSQSYKQWQSSFCSNVQQNESLQSTVRSHLQTVNSEIVRAFDSCVNAKGFHVWLERTDDPKVFKFVGRFNSPGRDFPEVKIDTFDTGDNVDCTEEPTTISNVWRTRCTRKNDEGVTLVVNANWFPTGGENLTLPPIAKYTPPPPPANVAIDTIICSGRNCDLPHIRDGKQTGQWQVARWESTRDKTKNLGPQLSLSDEMSKRLFCKSKSELTATDFASNIQSVDFAVTDNSEQARFFDLNDPKTSYFDWSSNGSFSFINNYEGQANHHIRLLIILTLKRTDCLNK